MRRNKKIVLGEGRDWSYLENEKLDVFYWEVMLTKTIDEPRWRLVLEKIEPVRRKK